MNVLIAEILVRINDILEHIKDKEAEVKLEMLRKEIVDFIEDFMDDEFCEEIRRDRYIN